jgi:bacteriorhodopsin
MAGTGNGASFSVNTGMGPNYFGNNNQALSTMGYTALWVAFAFIAFSAAALIVLSYIRNVKAEARLMYYLVALMCAITSLCYLIQAMGGAQQQTRAWIYNGALTANPAPAGNYARGFQWLRYVGWAFSAPITIFLLGHLSGAHWVEIIWVSLSTIISVASLYAATVSGGFNAVWPVFAFGCLFGIAVMIGLLYTFRLSAYRVHTEIGRLYDILGISLAILFVGYGITWGVSEGSYYTTQDMEVIIYATLDCMTKCTFSFALIYARESIARYGSFLGINTGVDFDFPIAKSTWTSSAQGYSEEPKTQVIMGESRDLGFAQLHAATNTAAPSSNVNWWPESNVPASGRQQL